MNRNQIQDSVLREDLDWLAACKLPFEEFRGRSILITGATGLIGSQLIRALLYCNEIHKLGLRVIALVRDLDKAKSILSNSEVEWLLGDVTQSVHVEGQVDYIVHAASITASKIMISNPVETIETALSGTKNMLELAKVHEACVIYISSMEVYGSFTEEKYVSEEDMGYLDPLVVRSNYPLCKRMCENMCIAYYTQFGVPVRIARLSQTFGAGILKGENRVFAQFARSVIRREDIVLHTSGQSQGNYCYTRDTVAALLLLMCRGENGQAYNIANEESHTTIADMAHMVANDIASGEIKVVFDIPKENNYGYAAESRIKLNTSKMQALGWVPSVNLKEAYIRMISSMIQNHDC